MANRRITNHTIRPFVERVDSSARGATAARRIAMMEAKGNVRPKPRHWTVSSAAPGTVLIYSPAPSRIRVS